MNRTGIRIAIFFFLLFALSCSRQANNDAAVNDKYVTSGVSRDMAPQVSDADLAAAVAGETDFSLKAFPLLEANPDTNTVFSPYSITLAVAMTSIGAKGTTLSEIETALSFTLPQDRLHPAFNKLDLLLASETAGTLHEDGSRSPQLHVVNAAWAQDGFPILPSYLDSIALNYGAGVHLVDYINGAEEARQTINAWINRETNNRIPELMAQGTVDDTTRLVLTNAIWFKADWSSKFSVEKTADGTFFNRDSSETTVAFMKQTFNLRAVKNIEYQAVDIPYVDEKLSMLVVAPTGSFDAFVAAFTPAHLSSIIGQLSSREVTLSLPKFNFSTDVILKTVLSSLGISAAFIPGTADLSGIDGNRDLFIQSAVHKAFISVDENGTEAAAATAIGAGAGSAPSLPIIITIDQPFIFAIRDRQTGLILFMGKVVKL